MPQTEVRQVDDSFFPAAPVSAVRKLLKKQIDLPAPPWAKAPAWRNVDETNT